MFRYLLLLSAALTVLTGCNQTGENDPATPTTPAPGVLEATDDAYAVTQATFAIGAEGGVLANDTVNDMVADTFDLSLSTQPTQGTVTLNQDGSFTYRRSDAQTDTAGDSFGYTLRAAGDTDTATVTLTFEEPDEPAPPGDPAAPEARCAAAVQVGQTFACQLEVGDTLEGAPVGMVIHRNSGLIRWTPTAHQAKSYTITVNGASEFTLTVTPGSEDPAGLYVAPSGDDEDAGNAEAPFATLQHAVDVVKPGQTIHLRGGDYYHPEYGEPFDGTREVNVVAKIQTAGTQMKPITLRAHGDEFVRIVTDEGGILFDDDANWWRVQGLELEGSAQSLTYEDAMDDWWADDNSRTSGNGVRYRRVKHLTLRDNVIHDFPGGGVASNRSEYVTVENNIVYNNGWWSTAGTHGVANSKLGNGDESNPEDTKVTLRGNLVFANRSIIISHVFSKAKVALTIDEGNGMHAQNNFGTFFGKALVENNLMLYNGKAGFGINTMDSITVRNNAFYRNAKEVASAAEITIQPGDLELKDNEFVNNLFAPREGRPTIRELGKEKAFAGVGDNVTSSRANDQAELPKSVTEIAQVFRDPTQLDFRPAVGVPADMGVPEAELARMFARARAYGVSVEEPDTAVTEPYLKEMRQCIFDTWPAEYALVENAQGEEVPLVLEDLGVKDEDGESPHYTYEQRCHYPGPPTDTPCP